MAYEEKVVNSLQKNRLVMRMDEGAVHLVLYRGSNPDPSAVLHNDPESFQLTQGGAENE
jgi:hypothetical protein